MRYWCLWRIKRKKLRSDGAVFECKELEVFTFFIFYTFGGISALVLFQSTEKSIKLHLIFKINILAATSKQFLANSNDSLGMTVRRNKVLLVENLVKNPFLPPWTAKWANSKTFFCGFPMPRYPKIACVKYETKQRETVKKKVCSEWG